MTNNTGERVGKTESWCEPEFDEIGGESCVRAQDSEVGHDREPKTAAHRCPLYGSNDRRLASEQTNSLDIKRVATLFVPRNGTVLSFAGCEISASAKVFSFCT